MTRNRTKLLIGIIAGLAVIVAASAVVIVQWKNDEPTSDGSPTVSSRTISPDDFATSDNTGVPPGWTPSTSIKGDYVVDSAGEVVEDLLITDGNLIINAPDVTVRRTEIRGGGIHNFAGPVCSSGLLIEDTTVTRGSNPTSGDEPAIQSGGYTARRVKIDGLSEGFRSGAKAECGPVIIEQSYATIQSPDICGDWHGDGVQGFDSAKLTIRNSSLILNERADCGGTAPFFYPADQGNTTVDIDGLLVRGGGFAFRMGTGGSVRNLNIVDNSWTYAPVDVDCSALSDWDAHIVTIGSDGQPEELRAQACS